MTENINFFEAYNNALKTWIDAFGKWTPIKEGSIFGARETDGEVNFFGYPMPNGYKAVSNFKEMMEKSNISVDGMKAISESLIKYLDSYRKISESYIRSMIGIAQEGYTIEIRSISGEKAEADKFFEAIRDAFDEVSDAVVKALEDTPFNEGVKEVDQALKRSLDTLSDEQQMAKALLEEMLGFTSNMTNLYASAIKGIQDSFSDIKENNPISLDAYNEMIKKCGETHKNTMEILGFSSALLPEYKKSVNDAINVASKQLDLLSSFLEMNLKSGHAIRKVGAEFCKLGDKESSQETYYKKWAENCEKAVREFIESSQINGNFSKIINAYTEWIKSANDYYRNVMMNIPYIISGKAKSRGEQGPSAAES